MAKVEIDVSERIAGVYELDYNGQRLLQSDKMGEIMDRIEREVKKSFKIKNKGIGGFFKNG